MPARWKRPEWRTDGPSESAPFAQAVGRRAKTDAIDAAVLAESADRIRPTPRPPVAADTLDCKA